ncbi:hypothetical protein MBCUT_06980 [Methanobrevibacter cuticularis]|uniref:Major tropism determinant N-terminal domain-containing protein n=1 Tax=Methanobrevibacter cuticularis TaxID=47311 RepID=A0A166EHI2_9EURY|nr:hypothetical protein [Methanobrevibacter cuticularis]KZX16660.1 hypothetical protein MBCUT_06980 [Methanobrevibacter cuticularis]
MKFIANILYKIKKGMPGGVAELDSNGKVLSTQLPSYVDDYEEFDSYDDFPQTGEADKVYLDKSTDKTYRWTGTQYGVIGSNIALGETPQTAYRGDRGKIAYDHSQQTSGNPHKVSASDLGLSEVATTGDFEDLINKPTISGGGSNGLPPIYNLKSGKFLYRANDPNKPVSDVNEDQTVLILSGEFADFNIAVITTSRMDYNGRYWVCGRWRNVNYNPLVEVTNQAQKDILNKIMDLNPTSFKQAASGQSLTVERSENIMCGYDWVTGNRPFSMYRQGCLLIFDDTIAATTYSARRAFIIGFGSQNSSSWAGNIRVGIREKPANSTTWGAETLY